MKRVQKLLIIFFALVGALPVVYFSFSGSYINPENSLSYQVQVAKRERLELFGRPLTRRSREDQPKQKQYDGSVVARQPVVERDLPILGRVRSRIPNEERAIMHEAALKAAKFKHKEIKDMILKGKQKGWDKDFFSYDVYEPTFHCGMEERIGENGDGGKWICGPRSLPEGCIIYSFGSNAVFDFEAEMVDVSPCTIYVFDPLPSIAERISKMTLPHNVVFHPYGLTGHGSAEDETILNAKVKLYSLPVIMAKLGHEFIDVLKVDVEGYEWTSLDPAILPPKTYARVGQLQIELHLCKEQLGFFKQHAATRTEYFIRWMDALHDEGFAVFHKEPNLYALCSWEYAFVNTNYYRQVDWD